MNEKKSAVVQWIVNHDDSRLFVVVYIGLAVTLSIVLGLFWLCAVVAVHYIFEYIRQAYFSKAGLSTAASALWEVKLDVFLIFFAFVIAVYMDVILGAAGLSAGARTAAATASRFAGWQRIIRGVALSLDDMALVIRAAGRRIAEKTGVRSKSVKSGTPQKYDKHSDETEDAEENGISKGDIFSLSFGFICILLIFSAPLITDHSMSDVFMIIIHELHPLP